MDLILQPPAETRTLQQGAAAWGLVLEEDEPEQVPAVEPFALWFDCLPAWRVMSALRTQWHTTGPGIRTGLRYGVIEFVAQRCGVAADEMNGLFEDLRVMEDAQLAHWYPAETH